MKKEIKIYKVLFKPKFPVPCGLIIAAKNKDEAEKIADETIKHTDDFMVMELDTSKPSVLFYESGNY